MRLTTLEFLCLSLLLVGLSNAQTQKIYASLTEGAEIIDLDNPSLGYASNLIYSTSNGKPELFFTADKGSPNVFSGSFDANADSKNGSFWANVESPLQHAAAEPYVTISVLGSTLVGASYPTRNDTDHFSQLLVQSAYVPPIGVPVVAQTQPSNDIQFLSFLISPTSDPNEGFNFVYAAGWKSAVDDPSANGFVVSRGHMFLNNSGPIAFRFTEGTDTAYMDNRPCYDLYNELNHPLIWEHTTYIIVALPGRCAYAAKIPIPAAGQPWSSVVPVSANLVDTDDKYVSSVAFDPETETLFYTIKTYFHPGAVLRSINTTTMNPNSPYTALSNMDQSEIILVVGNDRNHQGVLTRYVYVAAYGTNIIERFIVTTTEFTSIQYAFLDDSISRVSSAVYVTPYLYYTTYEPNAKLVRIHRDNFCLHSCGNNSFCEMGICKCRSGFSKDPKDQNTCISTILVNIELSKNESQGAAAALGVLFAFALIAAIAGWFLWYRSRKRGYDSLTDPKL